MRENDGDCETAGAFNIHKEGSGRGHEHLELVLTRLRLRGRVEKIDRENHLDKLETISAREAIVSRLLEMV